MIAVVPPVGDIVFLCLKAQSKLLINNPMRIFCISSDLQRQIVFLCNRLILIIKLKGS